MGWHGQLARPVGPLAQRNGEEVGLETAVRKSLAALLRSGRRFAGRDRRAAYATQREDDRRFEVDEVERGLPNLHADRICRLANQTLAQAGVC